MFSSPSDVGARSRGQAPPLRGRRPPPPGCAPDPEGVPAPRGPAERGAAPGRRRPDPGQPLPRSGVRDACVQHLRYLTSHFQGVRLGHVALSLLLGSREDDEAA